MYVICTHTNTHFGLIFPISRHKFFWSQDAVWSIFSPLFSHIFSLISVFFFIGWWKEVKKNKTKIKCEKQRTEDEAGEQTQVIVEGKKEWEGAKKRRRCHSVKSNVALSSPSLKATISLRSGLRIHISWLWDFYFKIKLNGESERGKKWYCGFCAGKIKSVMFACAFGNYKKHQAWIAKGLHKTTFNFCRFHRLFFLSAGGKNWFLEGGEVAVWGSATSIRLCNQHRWPRQHGHTRDWIYNYMDTQADRDSITGSSGKARGVNGPGKTRTMKRSNKQLIEWRSQKQFQNELCCKSFWEESYKM